MYCPSERTFQEIRVTSSTTPEARMPQIRTDHSFPAHEEVETWKWETATLVAGNQARYGFLLDMEM